MTEERIKKMERLMKIMEQEDKHRKENGLPTLYGTEEFKEETKKEEN